MNAFAYLIILAVLTGCSSPEESELERISVEIGYVESSINFCRRSQMALDAERGQMGLAEWDIEAAIDVDNISQSQEWEIRKSLGAEMNVAPSEMNGWKAIYRARAENARRNTKVIEGRIASAQAAADASCKENDDSQAQLAALEKQSRELQKTIDRQ